MSNQNKKEPDFSSYVISDVYEEIDDSDHHLYFRLNDIQYVMVIADVDEETYPGEYEIIAVNHEEGTCPRCVVSAEDDEYCHYFTNHSVALFKTLLPHLENRLRWLSRRVYY